MIKKIILFFSLALCALLLFSCGPTGKDPQNTGSDESEAVTPENIEVVAGGVTEYKIVRPDICADAVTKAAVDLRAEIIGKCGVDNIGLESDFEMPGSHTSARHAYEILIGTTNRDESAAALGMIGYNDYVIALLGTRVVILGGRDDKTVEAVVYFIENYIKDGSIILDSGLNELREAEYKKASLSLMGADISEYTIVYAPAYKDAAAALAAELGGLCGAIMKSGNENAQEQAREIIIGSVTRGVTGKYGYDDFTLRAEGTKIFIGGGSAYAVSSGCRALLDLTEGGGEDIPAESVAYEYTLPERDAYINDISLLAMHWSLYWRTPGWMLDFNEKYAAMNDPDGRLMSCLHRGDMVYYPENSIEGIISAIMMGGDMVEIDLRKTKDGIIVLMHDETLTRMTDVADKAGKNGLPASFKLSDWTYAELRRLNLRTANGGTGATVTQYKIPTFDEVMKVCSEKIFVRLDKLEEWNYSSDIWPVIKTYGAYSTVIFTWHSVFTGGDYNLVKLYKSKMLAAAGRASVSFVGCNAGTAYSSALSTITKNSLDNCVRLTDFNLASTELSAYLSSAENLLSGLKGKVRIYVDAHGQTGASNETPEVWQRLTEAGINLLLVNKGLSLCRYIGGNYTAAQY